MEQGKAYEQQMCRCVKELLWPSFLIIILDGRNDIFVPIDYKKNKILFSRMDHAIFLHCLKIHYYKYILHLL